MALEFALAVAAGLIVALISAVIQGRNKPPDTLFEVTHHTEAIVHSTTFVDGTITQEDTQIYIEESTFRFPSAKGLSSNPKIPSAAGAIIFAGVLAILLLLA